MPQAVPYIYLGIAAVGTGASIRSSQNAAKATEIGYKEEARQEELAARDREIQRRRQFIQSLASQNAEAGALGIDATTGSRRAIALEDTRRARLDSITDRAMTSRRAVSLRSAGRSARTQGNLQSAGTLLDFAGSTEGMWPEKKGGAGS